MKYVLLGVLLFSFTTGCNLNQNVAIRGVDLHTHEAAGDTYIDLEAIVSLGNLKLPNTDSSITDPKQHVMGDFVIQHLDDGTSRIAISVNYNEASKIDNSLGKTLPNTRNTPTQLGNEIQMVGIPVLQNSRLYVGGDPQNTFYAGFALDVPVFDHILSQIPTPLNMFMLFPFSTEVFGVGGIYTSPQVGQNGFAVFAKKTQPNLSPSTVLASQQSGSDLDELKKMDSITLFRLNYLMSKHAVLRIK